MQGFEFDSNNVGVEKPKPVRSFSALVKAMGYERDETEKPTTYLRTYLKKLPENGYATISVQDISGGQERFNVGVRMKSEPSSWEKEWSLKEAGLAASVNVDLPWVKGRWGEYDKQYLKTNGYQELRPIVESFQNSGLYEKTLMEMMTEYKIGRRLIEKVITPVMTNLLPRYGNKRDQYSMNKHVYFYENFSPSAKSVKAISLNVNSSVFAISLGRIKNSSILSGGYCFLDNEYTIAPPESYRFGWHFEKGDEISAKKVLEQAVEELKRKRS